MEDSSNLVSTPSIQEDNHVETQDYVLYSGETSNLNASVSSIKVIDHSGKTVATLTGNILSTGKLLPGIYLYIANGANKHYIGKLIIQ